ncbi:hypothetical protein [Williamsia deligens]|uniref:Phage tail protein n=1 Tax=Williamsia deligens TaxID=321325 RepID=A0ABW3G5U5_9NOCA|nr:hypothetical protein [Williamsia deligens]MCP2193206.1 hypothetical protein [Williamsia deligens]
MTAGGISARIDLSTRLFWRAVGVPIDPSSDDGAWLAAPHNRRGGTGDAWLEDFAAEGMVAAAGPAGLLDDMSALDGPGFRADDLDGLVRDFYEQTSAWAMDVWSQWNPLFAPGGAFVTRYFGRRVRQLALPTSSLSVSRGMTSDVRVVRDHDGSRLGAAWLRTLVSDGSPVYSGFYGVQTPPAAADGQPHVKVAFALEMGSVQVFLRPSVTPDGSLRLVSGSQTFGADGAYVSVRHRGRWFAARAPLREEFVVYPDGEYTVRTDHRLAVGSLTAMRLHYRLARVGDR